MEIASLAEIKKELKSLPPEEVLALCLRLAQSKKENKELLNYLLFEAGNEELYVSKIKEEVKQGFQEMNKSSFYLAKKTIRRVLRNLKKHIKYSGNKETEVALLLFFCQELKATKLKIEESKVLFNLFKRQMDIMNKALEKLHEDLQYDYKQQIADL